MNKPQDFDQYWKKVEDELASIQPASERTELHLRSAPEAKVYGLKLTAWIITESSPISVSLPEKARSLSSTDCRITEVLFTSLLSKNDANTSQ